MNKGLTSWSFVFMSAAFSVMLSLITGTWVFLILAVFPFAGKMLFGPRGERSTEAVRRAMKRRRTWYLLALMGAIGYFGWILVTHDAMRMIASSAAVIVFLAVLYVAMIIGAGRALNDDSNDNYG